MPALRSTVLALALLLAAASPAGAEFFPGEVIDGSPSVSAVGNADLATDGTGGVAYLRSDGLSDRVFVSRVVGGGFLAPEQIDSGLVGDSSQPSLVAYDRGALVAAWISGGRVAASVRAPGAGAWPAPTIVYDERAAGRTVTQVSVDASIYGVAYIAFTTSSPTGGSDVRVARLAGSQWIVEPPPLDVDPARNAGATDATRPNVSASAEGNALVVWGEDGADGNTHIFARRVTRRRGVATTVREISVPSFENRAGGSADSAEAAMEYDSSYAWVVFRQTFADDGGPRSRALARRLVGSEFDPPVALDGLGFPAGEGGQAPRIDLDGRGRGIATSARDASAQTIGSLLRDDRFSPPQRLDSLPNAGPPFAVPAAAENGRAAVAWQQNQGPGQPSSIRARYFIRDAFEAETELSRPELGSSDAARGLSIATDRAGDTIVAFVQGGLTDRKLVAAVYDRPPGRPRSLLSTAFTRQARPKFKWDPVFEFWGNPTYRVEVNGFVVGQTTGTSLRPNVDLPDGIYPYRLIARDRRGQEASGSNRLLRIDRTPPTAVISSAASVTAGRVLRVVVRPSDPGPVVPGVSPPPQGSGVVKVRVNFGDGSRPETGESKRAVLRFRVANIYRRKGKYRISARIYDRAGNAATVTRDIVVKRPPKRKKRS